MRFSLSTVVALGAMQTFGVYAQDCVNACIESVKPTVGCADATQAGCICVSAEFVKGVAECARASSCSAADADITNTLTNGFCVGQQVPALPEAATTPTADGATTSKAAEATSEASEATSGTPVAPETTEAAETTPAVETPGVVSTPSALPETSEAPEATPTDAAETAEPTTTKASASATDADSSSATSEAAGAAATSDSDEKEEDSAGGGMSGAAKAGVGIGVTIGILALIGIAGFFFWKKRQNQSNSPRGNMGGMSPPPMATRDRSYPSPDQGSIGEKHGYDLELMSHRYEDMLPREEPRHMV
ncbi:hypothetical protein DER45DRAFT_28459 [Fusarium avenaceum]|nr:hypothetical protein DER45DRAFT_28459 [Fusarium avenaceum]